MSAEADLREAYREWRRLAQAEGEAIRAANWSLLSACQKALGLLREQITELVPKVQQEWTEAQVDRAARQEEINEIIRGLIEIARRNQTLLRGLREAARAKLETLNEAGKNLRQLRRSYGQTSLSTWQSFS
jgi:uncharacterized protein involved in exopolysaccharide biosynthesis